MIVLFIGKKLVTAEPVNMTFEHKNTWIMHTFS